MMRRPPTSSASDTAASEDAATDSGNAMRLQLSSRTVSVRAGGPGLEQLTIMIIISSTREGWASTRGRVASLVRFRCLGMIVPSLVILWSLALMRLS